MGKKSSHQQNERSLRSPRGSAKLAFMRGVAAICTFALVLSLPGVTEALAEGAAPDDQTEQTLVVQEEDGQQGETESQQPTEPAAGDENQDVLTTLETGDGSAASDEAPTEEPAATKETPHVTYRAHVQKQGWQDEVTDGAIAGTQGKGWRMEALRVSVSGVEGLGIEYRAHVQKQGWQDWKSNGADAGTTGKGLRVEAVQLRLTGEAASKYDVYYRVHVQRVGWMGWAKNGERAGTTGYARRMEAIQIVVVPAGQGAPAADGQATAEPFMGALRVDYQAHVQRIG